MVPPSRDARTSNAPGALQNGAGPVTTNEPDLDERNAPPIRHHYVLVFVVQALTLATLWFMSRLFL